jgi:hypothetical protein
VDNIVATPLPLSANDTTTSISVGIISPNVARQGNVRPPFALPLPLVLVFSYYCEKKKLLSMFFMILTHCCVQNN